MQELIGDPMRIRWLEDGVERSVESENIAIQFFDSIKCELRLTLWDMEPWMEKEIIISGSEARRLHALYGISDLEKAEAMRLYEEEQKRREHQ